MVLHLIALGLLGASPIHREALFTLDHDHLSPADQVLAQTLQGLVNRERPRIWLEASGIEARILAELRSDGTAVTPINDVWSLVDRFRGSVKGAIEYKLETPSVNVATSLCGVLDCVAVDESQIAEAARHGLIVTLDARGLKEQQVFEKYRGAWCKGIVVEQSVHKPGALRDFAVKHRAFVMDTQDSSFRRRVVSEAGPNALAFGWGADEYGWISDIGSSQATGVAADWSLNLSALEQEVPVPIHLRPRRSARNEDGVRYVAFVLSDGDNVQWLMGDFATSPKFYGSPLRGRFPMSWEVSPLLSRFAPAILQSICSSASPNDDFVTGAGLPGYVYPHTVPDRAALARLSGPFLRASGLSIGSFLNQNDGSMDEVDPWLELPELGGAIYKDYSPYNRRQGELSWHNGKPCMAYRFVLWEGLMGVEDLVKAIAAMPTGQHEAGSYALVNVHAWSFGSAGGPIDAVNRVIHQLPPNTRVVTVTQLFDLLKVNHPR